MNVSPRSDRQFSKFSRHSVYPALRGSWKGGGRPRFEAPTARVLLGEMEGPVDRRYTAVVSPFLRRITMRGSQYLLFGTVVCLFALFLGCAKSGSESAA